MDKPRHYQFIYVPNKADGHNLCVRPCCRLIAGIGKKEKTKEEEEQIKKAPFYGITVHNLATQ